MPSNDEKKTVGPSAAECFTAEFCGTFLLVLLGCGAVHSAVLNDGLVGLWQVGSVWGGAIALAIFSVGAISGGHLNPAMTIAFAVWQKFPWTRVVGYITAQLGGALLAAATLYALFSSQLAAKENEKQVTRGRPGSEVTAMCFGEYFPSPGPVASGSLRYDEAAHQKLNERTSLAVACFAEALGTLVLAFVVSAVTDERNTSSPRWLAPVFIGLTVTVLICVLAPLTQAGFNPARDFGPRLFAYFAGWKEVAIPGPRGGFLTVYVLSPIIGAIVGVGLFRVLLSPALPTLRFSSPPDNEAR